MKKVFILCNILLYSFTGISQNIEPLESEFTTNFLKSDRYFKDVNNVLDKFTGTWKYENTSTNTIFEITFFKIYNTPSIHNCFDDSLGANFKLTINGVEKYNTYINNYGIMTLSTGFCSTFSYSSGNLIRIPPSINRYHMNITEPNFLDNIDSSDLSIEYENDLISEKLYWKNQVDKSYFYGTTTQSNVYQMPLEMILIKQ